MQWRERGLRSLAAILIPGFLKYTMEMMEPLQGFNKKINVKCLKLALAQ